MSEFDFLAIGDIAIDAFIRLKEAEVSCDIDHRNCSIKMRFADKIPYEFVEVVRAVGNSPNAAVSASRLGLSAALLSNIGDDTNGKECVEALHGNSVVTEFVRVNPEKTTNYHYVLWYLDERTILVKHEAYDYKLPNEMPKTKWIYLSSLGENSLSYHQNISEFLSMNSSTKLVFQPGTYQIKLGAAKLANIYRQTEIIVCNVEEAQRILNLPDVKPRDLLPEMQKLGPKIVCVTDGPQGAYAATGSDRWFMSIYPDPKPPYERTGCGDSFASTFTAAIALGKTIEEALMWAPINPMSVVQFVGAQKGLLKKDELLKLLDSAPLNYHPVKIP